MVCYQFLVLMSLIIVSQNLLVTCYAIGEYEHSRYCLEDDIKNFKGKNWSFKNFKPEIVTWATQQPNSNDCGVFVLRRLDRKSCMTDLLPGIVSYFYLFILAMYAPNKS